ncbi:MAG TPA: VOC family protein, partial [Chthoniobacteraceae bacterium]|nr:VOC family protein [Chthoniobacteraceae bacterium]
MTAQESSPDKLLLRAADHVLVWSQTEGAAENIFRKLGFNVRPGQEYPEGIGSNTIAFEDWSYVELLRFTNPSRAAGNAQALTELQFVRQAPGANSFAIQVSDAAEAAAYLKRKGFAVADIVPDMVDPDGPNGPMPSKVASWRDFHFSAPTTSGAEIFFIEYPPDPPVAEG